MINKGNAVPFANEPYFQSPLIVIDTKDSDNNIDELEEFKYEEKKMTTFTSPEGFEELLLQIRKVKSSTPTTNRKSHIAMFKWQENFIPPSVTKSQGDIIDR